MDFSNWNQHFAPYILPITVKTSLKKINYTKPIVIFSILGSMKTKMHPRIAEERRSSSSGGKTVDMDWSVIMLA